PREGPWSRLDLSRDDDVAVRAWAAVAGIRRRRCHPAHRARAEKGSARRAVSRRVLWGRGPRPHGVLPTHARDGPVSLSRGRLLRHVGGGVAPRRALTRVTA